MTRPTRSGNTEDISKNWARNRVCTMRPTVNEIVPEDCAVTKSVVVDITTRAVEVFSDSDQIANGGNGSNVREKL